MKMRLAHGSGVLFWGTIGPPYSDPAMDESAPEPWFSRVRSDLQARRERNWEEAPGGWELSPARVVMTSQPKSAQPTPPTQPPSLIKGTCQTLFCLLWCHSGWDLNRPGASEKLRAGSRSPDPQAPRPLPLLITHPHSRKASDVEVSADCAVGLVSTVQGSKVQRRPPV